MLVLQLAVLVTAVYAFVHAALQRPDAYTAAEKLTKPVWLVILGLIGAYATFVVFAWRDHDEYEIPADEVARLDRANLAARRNLVTAAGGA